MTLSQQDLQHLNAAQGYISLKMYLDANAELERVNPENLTAPQVLMLRIEIYRGLEKWELMQVVAKRMAHGDPNNPQWWISWAYAARRAIDLWAGRSVLLRALEVHPDCSTVHYNLACYECQIGDLQSAKQRLHRCFELDERLRIEALDDPDLTQIWDSK